MASRRSAIVRRACMRWSRTVPGRASRSTPRIACTARHATLRIRRRISPGSRPKGAVVPITRICRRRMRRFLPLIAPLVVIALAGCATQPQTPAAPDDDKTAEAFSTYLSARFAADDHDLVEAARYYGQALSDDPGSPS